MKTNPEQIPSEIFDWIEEYRFAVLDNRQQSLVLQHFSMEEYDELHTVCSAIRTAKQNDEVFQHEKIKAGLLERFDKINGKSNSPAMPMVLWKAAAALLALGFITVLVLLIRQGTSPLPSMVSSTDTVYITKEVQSAPLVSYDTVILEKVIYKQTSNSQKQEIPDIRPNIPVSTSNENIHTVTIRDLENTLNSSRGNSLKDDSLPKKYLFNTL